MAMRNRQHKIKGRSRTIPRPGVSGIGFDVDDDRWYSCWNCGFPCSEDRESLADSATLNPVNTESYQEPARPTPGDVLSAIIVPGGATSSTVLMELGADGVTPKPIYNGVVAVFTRGCPFCGTLNWRGDY